MPTVTSHEEPNFGILIDGRRRYVELRLSGHCDMPIAQRFESTLRQLLGPGLARGGCRIGEQVTLFDTSDFPVQSQDVLALLAGMAADRSIGSRRIAMILHSPLAKMQARRVAPDYAVFGSRADALQWLSEPEGTDQILVCPEPKTGTSVT